MGKSQDALPLPLVAYGRLSPWLNLHKAKRSEARDVILLEGDLLWREEYNRPDEKFKEFFDMWLRMCKSIHNPAIQLASLMLAWQCRRMLSLV